RRRCAALACSEQPLEKRYRSAGVCEIQGNADTCPLEAAPQFLALYGDAAAVDLDDQTSRCVGRVEHCFERRVDVAEEAVHLATPGDDEPALARQRLRLVLESRRVSFPKPRDARIRLDALDSRRGLIQIAARHARQMFEERTLIALLRGEERRPLLELDENEGVDGRRQTREHLAVLPRQRGGFAGQAPGE